MAMATLVMNARFIWHSRSIMIGDTYSSFVAFYLMKIRRSLHFFKPVLLHSLQTSILQQSSQLSSRLTLQNGKWLPQRTSLLALQNHTSFAGRWVVVGLEEGTDGPYLVPELTALLEVALDGEGIPELDGEFWDDVGSPPNGAFGAGSEAVECEGVPAIEGSNFVGQAEQKLSEIWTIARRVLNVDAANLREIGDLLWAEGEAASGGNIVIHDWEFRGLGNFGKKLAKLLVVDGVIEWWDHHGSCSARFGSMDGQIDDIAGPRMADTSNDWDASISKFDTELDELLALREIHGSELSGSSTWHDAVGTSLNEAFDVILETSVVDILAIIGEGRNQGNENTGELFWGHSDLLFDVIYEVEDVFRGIFRDEEKRP
jgi:hypothetical protein